MKPIDQLALLFDFYAPLLTSRQRELLQAYYLDDLSLGEIAGEEQVSRQAIHDQIKRAEHALQDFELRLGLVAEHRRRQVTLMQLQDLLVTVAAALAPDNPVRLDLERAVALSRQLGDDHDGTPLPAETG